MALAVGQDYTSASNSLAVQTGATGEELNGLNESMKDIYSQNYGESFEDIAGAMATVKQQAQDMPVDGVKELTTNALAMRDAFEFDITESTRAAAMLMDQFGISGTEAYNLIAQGAQNGLNKNGDLLDTINEYSVHFKQLGLDSETMFNMLQNGAESGTFSVDKLGDAVKEFGIRVKDGTADEAFSKLGISATETKQAFAEGGEAGKQAFTDVTNALFSMDDKVQQNLIGTELFGTMWEDLGIDGVKALTNINGEFDRTADTMERIKEIKYDDLGSAIQGLKRTLTTSLLLPIAEKITPAFSDLVNELNSGVSGTALEGLLESIGNGISGFVGSVTNMLPSVLTGISEFFNNISPSISTFVSAIDGIGSAIKNSVSGDAFGSMGGYFTDTFNTVVNGISGMINYISPLIGTIVGFFVNNIDSFSTFAQTAVGIVTTIVGIASSLLGPTLEGIFNSLGPILDDVNGFFTMIGGVLTLLQPVFTFIGNSIGKVAQSLVGALGLVLSIFTGDLTGMKESLVSMFDSVYGDLVGPVSSAMSSIGTSISTTWENMKTGFSNACENVKTTVTNAFDNSKTKIVDTFEGVKTSVFNIFDSIKTKISDIWDSIKSKFKMPSIKQTGTKSILGFDVPTFGIEWNAKGGIMTRPTIFGAVGNTLQAGGEAGHEAILPLTQFWDNLERFVYRAMSPQPVYDSERVNNNYFNITVNSNSGDSESIARDIARKVKEILDNM